MIGDRSTFLDLLERCSDVYETEILAYDVQPLPFVHQKKPFREPPGMHAALQYFLHVVL